MACRRVSRLMHMKDRCAYSDSIEQVVLRLLVVLEDTDVLVHLQVDLHPVVVPNRIFTQEIEDNPVGGFECDMLASERATTDSVSFIFSLFVTSTKGKLVDEVHGGRPLTICHDLGPQVGGIGVADFIDVILVSPV